MRKLTLLALAALAMSLMGCGLAMDSGGQVVADEVEYTDSGQPVSPYTGEKVELYSNHDATKDQSFRLVEKQVPCFECGGAGELPRSKVIALGDPLRTCMLCNGRGFLTYGERSHPLAPPKKEEVKATPSK